MDATISAAVSAAVVVEIVIDQPCCGLGLPGSENTKGTMTEAAAAEVSACDVPTCVPPVPLPRRQRITGFVPVVLVIATDPLMRYDPCGPATFGLSMLTGPTGVGPGMNRASVSAVPTDTAVARATGPSGITESPPGQAARCRSRRTPWKRAGW